MRKPTRIEQLITDPENARRRSERAEGVLKSSLEQFGAARSVVIDADGIVRAGNGTVHAATAAGIQKVKVIDGKPDELVVVRRPDLQGEAAKAYAIADNRTGELAEWDLDVLGDQLDSLTEFDAGDLGFDDKDLDDLFPEEPQDVEDVPAQMDRADELAEQWGTAKGQLWVIEGQQTHRLLCGDSTQEPDVKQLMGEAKATCVFTDPPYGVSIGAKNRLLNSALSPGRCFEDIADDMLSPDQLEAALLPAFVNLRTHVMANDCTVFVCAPQNGELWMMMMMMMQKADLKVRHVLIWKKNQPTFSLGRLDYDYQHEPILLTWAGKHKRPMNGPHRTSVWEVDRERKCDSHPTMKPPELYANAYQNNSDREDVVADIYAGSGTAFVAAEQLSRRCLGMEISPKYCAVILQRMTDAGCACRLAEE